MFYTCEYSKESFHLDVLQRLEVRPEGCPTRDRFDQCCALNAVEEAAVDEWGNR